MQETELAVQILTGSWFSPSSTGLISADSIAGILLQHSEEEISNELERFASEGLLIKAMESTQREPARYKATENAWKEREKILHKLKKRHRCLLEQKLYDLNLLIVALLKSTHITNKQLTGVWGHVTSKSLEELQIYLREYSCLEIKASLGNLVDLGLVNPGTYKQSDRVTFDLAIRGHTYYKSKVQQALNLENEQSILGFSAEELSVPQDKAKLAMNSAHNECFDIVILCALHKPELEKVLKTGNEPWEPLPANVDDVTSYKATNYTTKLGKRLRVVAAAPTQMGMPASAVLATKAILRFRPRLVAMVGIAAGVKSDEQGFGDILAPDRTFDYGSGKISFNGKLSFSPDPNPLAISPRVHDRLREWSTSRSMELAMIRNDWPAQKPRTPLELHVGPLGSGAAVLNTSQPIEDVRSHWRKLIGIEMEAYGVHIACRDAITPSPAFLCMKSICDFASDKNDDWQDYAAFTAAELFYRFLTEEWEQLHLVSPDPW